LNAEGTPTGLALHCKDRVDVLNRFQNVTGVALSDECDSITSFVRDSVGCWAMRLQRTHEGLWEDKSLVLLFTASDEMMQDGVNLHGNIGKCGRIAAQ
jgi:hypothetical protein